MTLQVIQTCDGCGEQRELKGRQTANEAGWREVSSNKHLCAKCISKALASDSSETKEQ
jgi:hypothetical protein